MKDTAIDAKNQRMLELLAQGGTSRIIARQMGYQEGTMRVYLHNLYRRIGVSNKTEAVVWYLNRERRNEDLKAVHSVQRTGSGDLFGDTSMEEDLLAALGVMSHFLGPYGRVWEVGQRLAGADIDQKVLERRSRARLLWRALLKGDWAYGKRVYDADSGAGLALDAPSDAVMLVAILMAGGYSLAADRLASQLTDKRRSAPGASSRESALIRAARAVFLDEDLQAAASIHKLATEKAAPAVLKQVAMAMLFHACKARGDEPRARLAGNALWAEAESARKQLEAMGERPLGGDYSAGVPVKASAREKAASSR